MKIKISVFIIVCFKLSLSKTVSEIIKENQIVPDIIDVAPESFAQVIYPSGAIVNLGYELTPTEVKDMPHVYWNDADTDKLYTLILTNPDATSRQNPNLREIRHWLVVNIPGNNIAEGQTLYEFFGSGPSNGTGLHRYIFLVFKQSDIIDSEIFVPRSTREGRLKTSTRKLISDFGLGNAIAGNFYVAQYDDQVPKLHQQLGGPPPSS